MKINTDLIKEINALWEDGHAEALCYWGNSCAEFARWQCLAIVAISCTAGLAITRVYKKMRNKKSTK